MKTFKVPQRDPSKNHPAHVTLDGAAGGMSIKVWLEWEEGSYGTRVPVLVLGVPDTVEAH